MGGREARRLDFSDTHEDELVVGVATEEHCQQLTSVQDLYLVPRFLWRKMSERKELEQARKETYRRLKEAHMYNVCTYPHRLIQLLLNTVPNRLTIGLPEPNQHLKQIERVPGMPLYVRRQRLDRRASSGLVLLGDDAPARQAHEVVRVAREREESAEEAELVELVAGWVDEEEVLQELANCIGDRSA